MRLNDFVLALFRDNKKPEELEYIKPCKNLQQVCDSVSLYGSASLYFVIKDVNAIIAKRIEDFHSISTRRGRIDKGKIEMGRYDEEKKRYYTITEHQISRDPLNQQFVKQKELDEKEVYIEEGL